jgi:hypothetical protein
MEYTRILVRHLALAVDLEDVWHGQFAEDLASLRESVTVCQARHM